MRNTPFSNTAIRRAGTCAALCVAAGLLVIVARPASAEESPISTERPSFSSSPLTQPVSTVQIEVGYQFTDDSVEFQTLPNALLRLGLAERWELQLGWAGWTRAESGGSSVRGTSDVSVGVKRAISKAGSRTPVAVFAGVSLPTGSREFSSDSVDPTVGVFWSHASSLDWFGTALISEADGDFTFSNGVGVNLPIGPRSGGYIEYVGQFPEGSGPSHLVNGGIAFTPRVDLQWDLYSGIGLNDRAPDFFVGAGVAYRF